MPIKSTGSLKKWVGLENQKHIYIFLALRAEYMSFNEHAVFILKVITNVKIQACSKFDYIVKLHVLKLASTFALKSNF